MHDVKGHLAVIEARGRSSPNLSPKPATWAESSAAWPRTTTRPLPNAKAMPSARPAAEDPTYESSNALSTAVSASLRMGTLPSGPLSEVPVKVWILVDPLGVVAGADDRVVAQEVVLAAEDEPRVAPLRVGRVEDGALCSCRPTPSRLARHSAAEPIGT